MIKKIFFLTLVSGSLFLSFAQVAVGNDNVISTLGPNMQVRIGNSFVDFSSVSCAKGEYCSIPWVGEYIQAVYRYGVGVAVILATVMMMIGGFIWLASAGSPNQISTAKNFISSALFGLLLALFSYLILLAVNPELVKLRPLVVYVPEDLVVQAQSRFNAEQNAGAGSPARPTGTGCPSEAELAQGVRAELTAYSRPRPENFSNDSDFLCAVGLNCSCPSGRSSTRSCRGGKLTWSPCESFNPNTTAYCNQTASGQAPREGTIAADKCFSFGTQLCINNQTYTVTDRGSAITGTHFDLWMDDYSAAANFYNSNATVVSGPCR